MIQYRRLTFLLLCFSLWLLGCKGRTVNVKAETIFSIPIGAMRDEINMFSQKSFLYGDSSSFTITPLGSYYIVDRSSRKIFYFTNHGKLNYIIYNPDFRFDSDKHEPQYLDKLWNFGEISEIAASQDKLYVTSTMGFSESKAASEDYYTQVILVFDNKGEYLYQLGIEGLNGSPFRNSVIKLFADSQGQLFVIVRRPDAYGIYQFSPAGQLLSDFELSVSTTILSNDSFNNSVENKPNSKSFYEITSPVLSYDGKKLFFELYHYIAKVNEVTSKTRQLNIYSYDLYSIRTNAPLNSPEKNFSIRKFDTNRPDAKQMYGEQLLGATRNNLLVFLQTYPNGENAIIYYDTKGRSKYIVTISVEHQVPYKLYLASNGLLSALNLHENRVDVVWWHTDKLFNKELF